MIPIANLNSLIVNGVSRFLNPINGNITGTASNVTGTVAIANGGTGATTAANARTALGLGGAAVKGVTDTYSSTGTDLTTGKAIADALGTLNISLSGVPGSSNTLTAFSQVNGKVNATFGSISITKSQISDFPTSMTPTSHTHGNIQNGGTLQTNDITIASGDKLVVTDSSDSSKLARTSISFDGSTTTQCLTKKGTWATFGTSNLTIGTTATTAMAGNTNVNNVTQTPTDTGNYNYEILFSNSGGNDQENAITRKSQYLMYNATSRALTISDGTSSHISINGSGDITLVASTWDGNNISLKTAVTNAKGTVTQTATTTNANYELLFSGTADNTTRTEGTRKSNTLLYNPGKNALSIQGSLITQDGITSYETIYVKDSSNTSHNDIEIGYDMISLYDTTSGVDRMMITHSDIEFDSSNTPNTWDGTNTSLKTALANKISKETNTTVSWTSSATGRTVTFVLAKIGTIVICNMAGSTDANHSFTAWTQTQLGVGQIPAGYRPSSAIEGRISTQTGGAVVIVNTVGTVAMQTWSNLGGQMAFGGTFWWKTS